MTHNKKASYYGFYILQILEDINLILSNVLKIYILCYYQLKVRYNIMGNFFY